MLNIGALFAFIGNEDEVHDPKCLMAPRASEY